MCQNGAAWYKLTPNNAGSYVNGTWSTLASLPSGYNPDAYASMVLANGKAVIIGGEYNSGSFALTNMGAVYDPKANTWTMVAPPVSTGSPNHWQCIGDAPATILSDGRFLVASKLYQDLAILDPNTLTWTELTVSGKNDTFNSEEGFTLLPDGSVFTLDVSKAPAAERLTISGAAGLWTTAGSTLQDLHTPTTSQPLQAPGCPVYDPPGEIGPHLLRPDGTLFAVGASGYTAIYTLPTAANPTGSFAIGPQLPAGLNVEDGPGALLPSGNVLFGASPGDTGTGLKYFEFNGSTLTSVPAPGRASSDATYVTQLLILPTGQILFTDGSSTVQVYNSAGSPNPSWAPSIGSISSTTLTGGATYQISGTQFNGLSQGTSFGDESQNPTNYPLVRITNNATGHVFYARTHDHSTMAVVTGSLAVSTSFDVPAAIEAGASQIQVVTNGIASTAVAVTVASTAPSIASLSPASGPNTGGTSVTITGANFAAGATVTFGGTFASVVKLNSATSITVTTPAHAAGAVSVVVTNLNGQSATLTGGFTYTTPAPTIHSVSPTSGTRNGGTTVTVSGSNFVSGATVTFGGTSASVRSTSATSISVRTPAHSTGTVNVVVTNPGGLSATLTNGYTYR
jgi:hypothetical protein